MTPPHRAPRVWGSIGGVPQNYWPQPGLPQSHTESQVACPPPQHTKQAARGTSRPPSWRPPGLGIPPDTPTPFVNPKHCFLAAGVPPNSSPAPRTAECFLPWARQTRGPLSRALPAPWTHGGLPAETLSPGPRGRASSGSGRAGCLSPHEVPQLPPGWAEARQTCAWCSGLRRALGDPALQGFSLPPDLLCVCNPQVPLLADQTPDFLKPRC